MSEVTDTVLAFIGARAPLSGSPEEQLEVAYLDEGLLDSMAVVELVVLLEGDYAIRFAPEDLQAPAFRTIGGLIATVERLRQAA
jgi:acyl carrier protein